MTTAESVLQARLDEAPWDSTARGILADELEEVGDERAEGYRALSDLGVYPRVDSKTFSMWCAPRLRSCAKHALPPRWNAVFFGPETKLAHYAPTRRQCEDAAARAFARLPAAVRASILGAAGVGSV